MKLEVFRLRSHPTSQNNFRATLAGIDGQEHPDAQISVRIEPGSMRSVFWEGKVVTSTVDAFFAGAKVSLGVDLGRNLAGMQLL